MSPAETTGPATGNASGDSVSIKDFAYAPAALSVSQGTRVTFSNRDSTNHTATDGGAGGFDTGTIAPGQTKTITLSSPGTFNYICSFHPFMHGTVTVRP